MRNRNNIITYSVDKALYSNLYISVQNGEVVVKAPWYTSKSEIQEIVEEKKQWIMEKLKQYETKKEEQKEIVGNNTFPILGENYQLVIIYQNSKLPKLKVENRRIEVTLPKRYKKIGKDQILGILIQKMYDAIAKDEIEKIMEKTRVMLGFAPEDYTIERMKDTLGRCSVNKIITIHPEIVKYRREILELVVLHEFCHLKYKTHAKGFYDLVKNYMPSYSAYTNIIDGWKY